MLPPEQLLLSELKQKAADETKHDPLKDQYTWDIVLVLAVGDSSKTVKVPLDKRPGKRRKWDTVNQAVHFKRESGRLLSQLQRAGLHVLPYLSVQRDEVYLLIGGDETRLAKEAERIEYDSLLDPDESIRHGKTIGVKLAKVTDQPDMEGPQITRKDWFNLYGKFIYFEGREAPDGHEDPRGKLYQHYKEGNSHPNSPFRAVDRIKLTQSIIEAEELLGGAGMSVRVAEDDPTNPILAFFCLHDDNRRKALDNKWRSLASIYRQPLSDIRDYFGESVAIYFAFLAFYTRWLAIPSIFGIAFFVWQLAADRVDVIGLPVFGILMVVWATVMLEAWKRRESDLSAEWGMHNFLQKENPRPEFVGEWEISPVNGKYEETFPLLQRFKRLVFSQTVIWSLITVVLAFVIGIFFFRDVLQRSDPKNAGIAVGIINAVQIQILNFVYGVVSVKLNDYENHRTDSQYEAALIVKSFLFKFINSYNSLFYIAFIKRYDKNVEGCLHNDCLYELQIQLGTIFATQLIVNNIVEILAPRIKRALKRRKESVGNYTVKELLADESASASGKSPPELQYEMEPYDSTFADFDEIVIQYGYATLFVVAFPIAPLLAMLNNMIENRVDSFKLCRIHRRPLPRGATNIGMWYHIFNAVSWIAVVTNIAILVFATTIFDDFSLTTKFLIFLFTEHVLLILKAGIAQVIPDMTVGTQTHLERQRYLVDVLINGAPDTGEFEFDDDNEADAVQRQV